MEIDWPGIRAAAVALRNVDEAARRAAVNLPPDEAKRFLERVRKRSQRQQWRAQWESTSVVVSNVKPLSNSVQNGADLLASTLSERKDKTKLHLSKYVVDASKRAAGSNGDLAIAPPVRAAAQLPSH